MAFRISGFGGTQDSKQESTSSHEAERKVIIPRKSLVQVHFSGRGMDLTYFNDQFDLKIGDRVYVDGKLEGQPGRVTGISYNFKIKLSDYKKVIAVVDTDVHGQFYLAGSHFVSFDPKALPAAQVELWFRAPVTDAEAEVISSTDDTAFRLDDLKEMPITAAIAERGHDYHIENKVRYLCLDDSKGFAIVEGSEGYTVEFSYQNGEISRLICDCPCGYPCKHEFAAMLQLRETLKLIEKHYAEEYRRTGYFAAIAKGALFTFAIDGKETGKFEL